MEKEVLNFDIKNTYILQPSLIEGQRREKRKGEWFFRQLASAMPFLKVGPLKKFQPVPAYKIAKAMVYLANSTHKEIRIKNHKIHEIADAND